MHTLFAPALAYSEGGSSGDDDIDSFPPRCLEHIWQYVPLSEKARISAICSTSRVALPAGVRLAIAVQCLRQAFCIPSAETELQVLIELTAREHLELWHHVPAVIIFLCNLLRCSSTSEKVRLCSVRGLGRLLGCGGGILELFASFDCNSQGPAVVETALEALATAATPEMTRKLALETLVIIGRAFATGARETCLVNGGDDGSNSEWPAMWAERQKERTLVQGQVKDFNRNPEAWWQKYTGFQCASETSRFIIDHRTVLDGAKVGDFLGRHLDVMTAFVGQFDLAGLSIVQALVRVLHSINMPGEAQQVDKFVQCFGAAWGRANDIDPDAAYIFTFSVVMLSTDLHAPTRAGHERMTLEQFEQRLNSAVPAGSVPCRMIRDAYAQLLAGALVNGRYVEDPMELCSRLHVHASQQREALTLTTSRGPALVDAKDRGCLWRALWTMSWGPLLSAFSVGGQAVRKAGAGCGSPKSKSIMSSVFSFGMSVTSKLSGDTSAHAAGEEIDALQELALRGLQLGCEAAALLGEPVQAEAFSIALRQLSP